MDIEIWSDIACPWCYVGKRRFEAALAAFEHRDEVAVTWRSFELDPTAPAQRSVDSATHLAEKYGMSRDEAIARPAPPRRGRRRRRPGHARRPRARRQHLRRPPARAAGEGQRGAGRDEGAADARLPHRRASSIGDADTLLRLALEVGLPEDDVREVLATDRYATDVREDERTAMALGISAVPFFVVDRRMGAAGAHPAEALGELLRRGWEARVPA